MINCEDVFLEILEHTRDCDYNKSAHFKQYNKYKNYSTIINIFEVIIFITITAVYAVFFEFENSRNTFRLIAIFISIFGSILSIVGLAYDYEGEANNHWIAAQSYGELYRECQFFFIHNYQLDLEKTALLAREIADKLHFINLNSPHIDTKIFKELENDYNFKNKVYPIEKFIKDNNVVLKINEIIFKDLSKFQDKIDVYIYGSYLKEYNYNDIDIAILINDTINLNEKISFSCLLEESLLKININADIIIEQIDIFYENNSMFVKNILEGKHILKSTEKKTFEKNKNNYNLFERNQLHKFYEQLTHSYCNNDIKGFLIYSYYFYYYLIQLILLQQGYTWTSENDLKNKFFMHCRAHEDLHKLMDYVKKIDKYKNLIIYDLSEFTIEEKEIKGYFTNIKEFISIYRKI